MRSGEKVCFSDAIMLHVHRISFEIVILLNIIFLTYLIKG